MNDATQKLASTPETYPKASLIQSILPQLKQAAQRSGKPFDEGDTWFALAFRTKDELEAIAKECGITS